MKVASKMAIQERDYSNENYRAGDRYDVDNARVVPNQSRKSGGKWLLPLLIIPLLALAGSNFLGNTNHPVNSSATAQFNQNIPQVGIGGGPEIPTPTISIYLSNQTDQNIPQAGIGGRGADTNGSTAAPSSAPSTGRGGR
ncbi:hypothetical protein BH09PAT1_BH09PAT1_5270 [soil metagenome]